MKIRILHFFKLTLILMLLLQAGRVSAQCSVVNDSFISNNPGWTLSGCGTAGNGLEFSSDGSGSNWAQKTSLNLPANLTVTLSGVKWKSTSDNNSLGKAILYFKIGGTTYLTIDTGDFTSSIPTITANNGATILSGGTGSLPSGGGTGALTGNATIVFTVPNAAANGTYLDFTFLKGGSSQGVDDLFIGGISLSTATTKTVTGASSSPNVCISTPITNITHTTTGVTSIGTPSNLPAGVTATYASNTVTISGTPSASGTFNYSIPLIGSCGSLSATGTITVKANNTVAASTAQTVCIGTALTTINLTTTGATGIGAATGLPTGISATWAANKITISGTPSAAGTFTYSIPLTGGCGTVNATGTITVTANRTVAAASSTPTVCISTALTAITHATTGVTGVGTATGLPAGVTATYTSNVVTISGTPSAAGTFNYTIPLTGCGTANATGTITVTPNKTVTAASATPTVCINNALTNITHTTTGATGIGSATGLPAGVSAAWSGNTITISGTPSASGTFTYSIPLTGGCGTTTVNATGTITVTADRTVGAASSTPTVCINTALTNITHATTGVTGIGSATGLPAGVTAAWNNTTKIITISGTPTASGTFNYTIPLTGCGTANATGIITVNANTVTAASTTPSLCVNTALTAITHTTTGATGIGTPTGLPAGVSAAWSGNTITITGTPTASGTFAYSIPLTGGCGTVNATGTITVNALPAAPSPTATTSTNTCPTTSVNLNSLVSNTTTLKWYTDSAHTTEVTTPTAVTTDGMYYPFYVATGTGCYSAPIATAVTVTITNCCATLAPPTFN